ncbi:PP2C family protein-serine/threonine phosphatase [Arthrobacter mobilis]|uniref:Serine/threonine-protein phosphatase n=1 Tax=Arthrobacter mobilis TaxID=2724944 RepID=A0A7X6K3D1_9MICC|nr:PP2C family serine/threonine-protein phosphatase [Arthrobacter mobilis]NKX53380.1 serine/threonine-protein phosphatase [Arthrobacter mobilis]
MASIRLTVGQGTDRGLRRQLNEDALLVAPPLFAVADGMGGHEAGDVASRICVETLQLDPAGREVNGVHAGQAITREELRRRLAAADQRIRQAAGSRAGTTVSGVALVEAEGRPAWLVFNVGDSRTYRLRQGRLEQITRDHSEVQELQDLGRITAQQALVHPRRNVITRALGTGEDAEPDFWLLPVEPGDRMLICSDGLTGEVSDDHLHTILATLAHPQDVVDSLIQAALRSGGRDNITLVVIDAAAD